MAERMSTAIVIALILLNGATGVMAASGLTDTMGVKPNPGMSDTLDDLGDNVNRAFSPGSSTVDTLFGMFAAGLDAFKLVTDAVTAAPTMALNLGLPAWFVAFVFSPLYLVAALDLIYLGTGRSL